VLPFDSAAVAEMPREELPGLLAHLAALTAAVAARLVAEPTPPLHGIATAPHCPPTLARDPKADRWLTVAQVTERLGLDQRQVYRRAHAWPFTVRLGKRLMFSESGLAAWMERHRLNGHT
jgi:predicted DNA-binding transcriptional regulator AlpA